MDDFDYDDDLGFERELCARSLAEFAQRAWHVLEPTAQLKWGWALDAICQHLEAVTDGRITRLLMNVPPGTMKSLLTGVIWPAWEWGPRGRPEMRFIGTAHEETLAIRDSRKCRDLIKSEWFQSLWPLPLDKALDGKREFGNMRKGVRQARSFTSMTGVRGDCLLAGSMIHTDKGIIAIEEIVDSANTCNVLSYDHDSKQLVYRPIEAVARRSSSDFYRVHFANGVLVECTGDHRIYTTRGYVEARFLSEGDSCMCMLQCGDCSYRGGNEKAREKRICIHNLLSQMQPDHDKSCSRQDGSEMHGLRKENTQKQSSMLFGVQSGSVAFERTEKSKKHGYVHMPSLRNTKATQDACAQSTVLLSGLQGRQPCCDDAWAEQSRMEKRSEFQEIRQRNSACLQNGTGNCSEFGSRQVCCLQFSGQASLPSHRPQLNKQQTGKPCDALPVVPHETPCSGTVKVYEISVSMVERVCQDADVFDIQVSGTRCFFANGVLVHNCIILDDPLSAHAANSEAALDNARVAFTETLPTRINSDKSAIVVIMQRLHEQDTSGVILDMGLPYVHLCIPMRFEPANRCTTEIGWTDPRTEAGELMFPERFTEAQVQELERTLGSYGTAGQLQQRPAPRGGGLFKDAWWQYWRALPELTHRSIYADTAQKTKTQNDYSVFQCWGRTVNNKAVLIDQIRGKWEAPELLMHARAFWAKHRAVQQCGVLRAMRIEDKSSGTGLIQTLAREGIPVAPIQRSSDKVSRAMDVAPLIEAGHVIIPADAPWLSEYMGEFSRFPTGAHDDQIDPTMDAIADMLQNSAHGYAVGKGSNHR